MFYYGSMKYIKALTSLLCSRKLGLYLAVSVFWQKAENAFLPPVEMEQPNYALI